MIHNFGPASRRQKLMDVHEFCEWTVDYIFTEANGRIVQIMSEAENHGQNFESDDFGPRFASGNDRTAMAEDANMRFSLVQKAEAARIFEEGENGFARDWNRF